MEIFSLLVIILYCREGILFLRIILIDFGDGSFMSSAGESVNLFLRWGDAFEGEFSFKAIMG